MKNINHFRTSFLFISVFLSLNLSSQSVEWVRIHENLSVSGKLSLDKDSTLLHPTSSGLDTDLTKYDLDGDTIWVKDICNCSPFRSLKLPNDSLLHVTTSGEFYISDSEANFISYAGHMLPDSIDKDSVMYESLYGVYEEDDGLIAYGYIGDPGKEKKIATTINYDPFRISSILTDDDSIYIQTVYKNEKIGESLELYSTLLPDWTRIYKYKTYDTNGQVILDNLIDSSLQLVSDAVLTDEHEIIIIGSHYKDLRSTGQIIKYGSDGTLLFEKTYSGALDNENINFEKAILDNGELIVAGNVWSTELAIYPSQDTYIAGIDLMTGNINWELRHKLVFEGGNRIVDLISTSNGNLLVAGLTGLSDIPGSVAFLMKVKTELSGIEKLEETRIVLYPNPSINQLYIQDPNKLVSRTEVYDDQARLLLVQESSEVVDISSLVAGSYVAKITTIKGNEILKKFIKQ